MAALRLLFSGRFWAMLCEAAACQAAQQGSIPELQRIVAMEMCVGDDLKLARKVSVSTYVSSWHGSAWSAEANGTGRVGGTTAVQIGLRHPAQFAAVLSLGGPFL